MNPNEPAQDPSQLSDPAPTPEASPTPTPQPMPSPTQEVVSAPIETPASAAPIAPVFSSAPSDTTPAPKKLPIKMIIIIASIVVGLGILGTVGILIFRSVSGDTSPLGVGSLLTTGITTESYANQDMKFSIDVPKGWKPDVDPEVAPIAMFTEPVGDIKDKSEANLHYAAMRVKYSDLTDATYSQRAEDEYFSDLKKSVQQTVADSEAEDEDTLLTLVTEEEVTVNGLKAYKVTTKQTDKKDKTVNYDYTLFVFIDKAHQYAVSLQADESETAILKKADQILASFKHL